MGSDQPRWRLPDDAVVGLDNEQGYTGTSGEGDTADWETASFSLANYTNQDVDSNSDSEQIRVLKPMRAGILIILK